MSSFPATSHGDRFISNTAGTQGGGLEANDAITLTGDTFWGNAAAQAGGVDLSGPGGGVIANTLFADNVVSAPATSAAALHVATSGPVSLLNDTLANRVAVAQTAVAVQGGPLFVTNTIISGYSIALTGTGITEDYNLFFGNGANAPTALSGGHSLVADPLFVGPAAGDFHITFGSPARDAGVDVGLLTDFDGDPRPSGRGFDIGYDELAELNLFLPLIMR